MDYDSVINSYLDQEQSQLSDMTVKISEYLEERLTEQYAYEHDDEFESLYRFSEEKIAEIIPQLSEEKSVGALAKWLDIPEHGAEIMEEFKKHLLSVEIFERRLTKEETEKLLPDGKWGSAAEEFIADMLKPPGQEQSLSDISSNMKAAQGNNVFVLSEMGYRHRAAKGINDIKPGQILPEYKNKVPKSWAEKGWVKEVSPDALSEIQQDQTAIAKIPNNRRPIIELEP